MGPWNLKVFSLENSYMQFMFTGISTDGFEDIQAGLNSVEDTHMG